MNDWRMTDWLRTDWLRTDLGGAAEERPDEWAEFRGDPVHRWTGNGLVRTKSIYLSIYLSIYI